MDVGPLICRLIRTCDMMVLLRQMNILCQSADGIYVFAELLHVYLIGVQLLAIEHIRLVRETGR